jgi:hypothetical protein
MHVPRKSDRKHFVDIAAHPARVRESSNHERGESGDGIAGFAVDCIQRKPAQRLTCLRFWCAPGRYSPKAHPATVGRHE